MRTWPTVTNSSCLGAGVMEGPGNGFLVIRLVPYLASGAGQDRPAKTRTGGVFTLSL